MQFNVVTLFPQMFKSPFAESMIKRAIKKGIMELNLYQLRDWAVDNYGSVDDRPFGGDVGMLLRPEPIYNALKAITRTKRIDRKKPKKKESGRTDNYHERRWKTIYPKKKLRN